MGRARAMLIQAGIESKYKGEFWCEVISTATKLDNIMVRPERTKPPHTLLTENVPKTLSKVPCLVAKRMSPTLHLLLFAQSM